MCLGCGTLGKIFVPDRKIFKGPIMVSCPTCYTKADMSYAYKTKSLEEIKRSEYERLKLKYGGK
jgi:hypothetical protein